MKQYSFIYLGVLLLMLTIVLQSNNVVLKKDNKNILLASTDSQFKVYTNYDSLLSVSIAKINTVQKRDSTPKTKDDSIKFDLYKKIYALEVLLLNRADKFEKMIPIIENMQSFSPNFNFIPAMMPCKPNSYKRLSSGFGYRVHPVRKTVRLHAGLDIAAEMGTNAYATANGVVTASEYKGGYGNTIVIKHPFGFETLFGHLSARFVHVGQAVTRGEIIGAVGSTGLSTGPHLHYEVHKNGNKINPIAFTNLAMRVFFNDLENK